VVWCGVVGPPTNRAELEVSKWHVTRSKTNSFQKHVPLLLSCNGLYGTITQATYCTVTVLQYIDISKHKSFLWYLHAQVIPENLLQIQIIWKLCIHILGHAVAKLVEALCYKVKCHRFDSQWCHWIFNWSDPSSCTVPQPLTEMSTRNLPRGKGLPACKADNLTAICELTV
jgi:hypothetical protein